MEAPGLFLFLAGGAAFGVRGPESGTPAGDKFDLFRVGLDHVALACEDEGELERVAAALSEAGVENTGVKLDETHERELFERALYERPFLYGDIQKTLEDGLKLCDASAETGNPVEFLR